MGTAALATTAIGGSLIGGIMQGVGAKNQYEAQAGMYGYQAKVAQINSTIDKQNADYAIQQGELQAQQYGLKAGQQYGQIKASEGASGIAVGSGSSAQVLQSQRKLTSMDLDQIRSNAAKVSYDYTTQSVQDLNQAGLYNYASSNASSAGNIALASSLVSTAGSVSSKWLAGVQSGALPNISLGA